MSVEDRIDAVRTTLESLIEELDQISFDELQAAMASGLDQRPMSDRKMVQARRALEKAHHLLGERAG